MPLGCFLVTFDPTAGPACTSRFFEAGPDSYEVNDDLLLRLQMQHASKVQSSINQTDSILLSRSYEDRQLHFIVCLVLTPLDKPEAFTTGLKDSIQNVVAQLNSGGENMDAFLEELYFAKYRTPQVTLDSKKLEENIKTKAKKLLASGETKEAEDLLEKVTKQKIPKKLYNKATEAERDVKKGDYEAAGRDYEEAVALAKELGEVTLADYLLDKAKNAQKLPQIIKTRDQTATDARKALREEKFELAAQLFRRAADLSGELLDTRKAEEFTLKAKALQEFASVEKKYR
ncbi:MAG TPA: hypothetical protein VKK79_19215 [Candidatus Lokiarchaeia archaeon]|nr:hypothetical protein [Candidatus Lokiarchaeia archaeon]